MTLKQARQKLEVARDFYAELEKEKLRVEGQILLLQNIILEIEERAEKRTPKKKKK